MYSCCEFILSSFLVASVGILYSSLIAATYSADAFIELYIINPELPNWMLAIVFGHVTVYVTLVFFFSIDRFFFLFIKIEFNPHFITQVFCLV